MSSQEIEQFETHMDRMERERQAQASNLAIEQERTKRAKIEARSSRHEAVVWVFACISAAAVVLGIIAAIFFGVDGPSAEQVQRQEHIEMCYERGGTWEPEQSTGADGVILIDAHCSLDKEND